MTEDQEFTPDDLRNALAAMGNPEPEIVVMSGESVVQLIQRNIRRADRYEAALREIEKHTARAMNVELSEYEALAPLIVAINGTAQRALKEAG